MDREDLLIAIRSRLFDLCDQALVLQGKGLFRERDLVLEEIRDMTQAADSHESFLYVGNLGPPM